MFTCKAVRCALVGLPLIIGAPVAATADGGEAIVTKSCAVCHGAGLMGAPKIGDTAGWQTRLQKAGSLSGLAESAEHGKGAMPPRGGVSRLTDADLAAATQYMLEKSGVVLPAP